MQKPKKKSSHTQIDHEFYQKQLKNETDKIVKAFTADLHRSRDKEGVLTKYKNIIHNKTVLIHGNSANIELKNKKKELYDSDKNLSEFAAITQACKQQNVDLKKAIFFLAEYESLYKSWDIIHQLYSKDPERKLFTENIPLPTTNKIDTLSLQDTTNTNTQTASSSKTETTSNPYFLKDKIPDILLALEPYFENGMDQLKDIMLNWKISHPKILFRGQAFRLADVFLKLHNGNIIIGDKKHLINWILENFMYVHRSKSKNFTIYYLKQCLYQNNNEFKKLILDVVDKQIIIK